MQYQTFDSSEALTEAAKNIVVRHINTVVQKGGRVSFFLSGGTSPIPLYKSLSEVELDWDKVDVAQVDERWVAPHEDSSNTKLIRETLLRNKARNASFTSMKTAHDTPQDAEVFVNAVYKPLMQPNSIAILGIGTDGHVASWFPDGVGTEAAMDCKGDKYVSAVKAKKSEVTGDNLDRMTLTMRALKDCAQLVLLTRGEKKKVILDQAIEGNSALPVSQLIQRLGNRLTIFYAEG